MKNYSSKLKIPKSFKFLVVVFIFSFFVFSSCQAAKLYLEPAEGEYYQDDTFIAEIRLNSEGEYINTVKVDLSFPQDVLEIRDFSTGNSVLTLWIETPSTAKTDAKYREGVISFIGGVPAGYQGWDGLLARIVIRARETDAKLERETDAKIEFLNSCQVLLNDGFGTPAKLTTKGAILIIREVPQILTPRTAKNEWQAELEKDTIPPEAFDIEILQDPSIFEGKHFIIFSTTDKQTGLDYYEIKEGGKDWQRGESPYLLEDQKLQSIIKVKAVDKAGNERIVLIGPVRFPEKITWKDILPWIILVLVVGGITYWVITKYREKRHEAPRIRGT